ncbi:gene transfer agent family protein [Mesorhizobium sp. YC-39]|uniref:gene transfer agent family protein n=1 Tax=unclassified Mesorhizobium TaxID=325217 RepID=UPI0021E85F00|nr:MULTISPECIES: gene transfer agent family protein [unclassified Mesorhizobium]MCV3209603.1 gene transfer agent family protein [Mesorhizobium sp. YC-2]MCV3230133.1 gene transfer agent family protein [Mesorhizobium sp. YC-39]
MSNPHRGTVTFEADGAAYTLKFSTNALIELEEALGTGIEKVGSMLADPNAAKLKTLRLVFWAALTDHHEGMTVKTAGDLIDAIGVAEAGRLVSEAFNTSRAIGKQGGAAKAAKNPQKATTA